MYIYIYVCVCVCIYIYTPSTGQGLRRVHVLVRGQIVYWSVTPQGVAYWSGVGSCTGQGIRRGRVLVRGRIYVIHIHTHTHTHTHRGFFFLHGCIRFLTPGRRVLSLKRARNRLSQRAHGIGFLSDCLFSPNHLMARSIISSPTNAPTNFYYRITGDSKERNTVLPPVRQLNVSDLLYVALFAVTLPQTRLRLRAAAP